MVIRNFNLKSVALTPYKANSELIVDPNTVLPCSIAAKVLQLIARRYP